MASLSLLLCLFSIFFCCCTAEENPPKPKPKPYTVGYFEQYIDHFNELSNKENVFKQKYLISDKHWKAGSGPIFVYTGNEGPIEGFWKSAGFVHELAAESGALVIFIEHRYFGVSMPFGDDSFKNPQIGYLSVDQALADFAVLLTDFTKKKNASGCKIVAFGGSYGGMLAAYMRFKYPNLITGSLAASAPIFMQDPNAPKDFFFPLVTENVKNCGDKGFCYRLARRVFIIFDMFAKEGTGGLHSISRYFNLCQPLKTPEDYKTFLGWLRNAFTMMSMLDYPYAVDLPANPVKAACKVFTKSGNPIYGMAKLVGVYYNSSKSLQCFDMNKEYRLCADPTGCGQAGQPSGIAWDYLACTEVLLPSGNDGVKDMFLPLPWTVHMRAEYCLKTFGVMPRLDWPSVQFWGRDLLDTSNIIFSNGDLDPWRGGGVTKSVSESVVSIMIKGGAHHLDLRASNPADPPSVVDARKQEKALIHKWIGLA